MKRVLGLVGVLFAIWLVVSSAPVAAATNEALGSIHTTETELDNATQKTNVTVRGSGDAGYVRYTSNQIVDSFEDGNLNEYSGDTGSFNVNSNQAYDGTLSLENTGDGSSNEIVSTSGLASYPSAGDTIVYYTRYDTSDTNTRLRFGYQDTNNWYSLAIENQASQIRLREKAGGVNGDLDTAATGVPSDVWIKSEIAWEENGDINVTVSRADTGAVVATLNANDGTLTSGGISILAYGGGAGDDTWVDYIQTKGTLDGGRYIGQDHDVTDPTKGFVNLSTVSNTDVKVEWQYWDGSQYQVDRVDSYTSAGNKTVTLSSNSDRWRVNVTVNQTGSDPLVHLSDEGLLFENHDPVPNNGQADPSGGEKLSSPTVTFSIPVNDTELGSAQGDNVTAEFFVDGSSIGTQHITSNQTVMDSSTVSTGGEHTWHVDLNDKYGGSGSSSTFTFSAPSKLTIYNVSNVSQKVTNANASVTFYGDDTVHQREDTDGDGSISLEGLPVNQKMVVTASAKNYTTRTVIIDSIYQQQSVYLLPNSVNQSQIIFQLQDSTGRFPPDGTTELIVERPLNTSGSTEYERVFSDTFDVGGESLAQLEDEVRYRLRVRNSANETRLVGSYTTAGDDSVVIPIGQIQFSADIDDGTSFRGYMYKNETGSRFIKVIYRDDEQATSSFSHEIAYANDTSKFLVANNTLSGPYGILVQTYSVPGGLPENQSFVVNYSAVRDGNPNVGGSRRVGLTRELDFGLPPNVANGFAMVFIVAATGLVVIVDARAGAIAAVIAAGLVSMLGLLAIPNIALGIAATTALFWNLGRVR